MYGSRRRTCRCCEERREVTGQQRASLPILNVYVSPCRQTVPLAATGKLLPHVAYETSSIIIYRRSVSTPTHTIRGSNVRTLPDIIPAAD